MVFCLLALSKKKQHQKTFSDINKIRYLVSVISHKNEEIPPNKDFGLSVDKEGVDAKLYEL